MAEVEARGTARVGFGQIDQAHRIKPTSAFGLLEEILPAIWQGLAGTSRDAYFAAHPARLVFSHLRIDLPGPRLELDEEVVLSFDGLVGAYPGRDGRPRYGLKDQFAILSANGEPALRWTAEVFWIHADGPRAGRFLDRPAPGLRHGQEHPLEPPPPRPDEAGTPVGTFRWTPRETDFNRHVYFQSYLERAENTLADAGIDPAERSHWDLWFLRPAFLGDTMHVELAAGAEDSTVGLRRGDELCCIIQSH